MNIQPWSPNIPETDIPRIEFLMMLRRIYESPDIRTRLFVEASVLEIARYGVLSYRQIAAVCRERPGRVLGILRKNHVERVTRFQGTLDPNGLDGMTLVCQKRSQGTWLDPELIRQMTRYVPGSLGVALTGISLRTFKRYREDDRKRRATNTGL